MGAAPTKIIVGAPLRSAYLARLAYPSSVPSRRAPAEPGTYDTFKLAGLSSQTVLRGDKFTFVSRSGRLAAPITYTFSLDGPATFDPARA